jgi:AcrR family transcriptional regulator
MIHGEASANVFVMTSLEVFFRGTRRAEISLATEGARVSETPFYENFQPKEDLIRAFLEDRNTIWLRWFQREIDARLEITGGGLEIIVDVLRKWFEISRLPCQTVKKDNSSSCEVNVEVFDSFSSQKDQLRRFVEQLARKMGLRCSDIAASAAVQIIERTIVAICKSCDLSELMTAQLLFQCLQHALSNGSN